MSQYERKSLVAKAADEQPDEEGVVRFVASTGGPDRHGDTIDQAGWQFPSFIAHLWKHDKVPSIPALGRVKRYSVEDRRLVIDSIFDLEDDFAAKIYRKHKKGFLAPVSVGFIPKEGEPNDHGGIHFTKQELVELSTVHVGANPDAMQLDHDDITEAMAFAKALKAMELEAKDGRVLSQDNYDDIKSAKDRLERVLEREGGSADDEGKAAGDDEEQGAVLELSGQPAEDEADTGVFSLA